MKMQPETSSKRTDGSGHLKPDDKMQPATSSKWTDGSCHLKPDDGDGGGDDGGGVGGDQMFSSGDQDPTMTLSDSTKTEYGNFLSSAMRVTPI